jgi:ectoine hydroxylase
MVDRPDPSVWGTSASGPLSPSQLALFAEQGFLVWKNLLSAEEVAILQNAARALQGTVDPGRDGVITEPNSSSIRSVFRVHEQPIFGELAADPRLAGVARQILSSDVYIHQSRINFKPGFEGLPFPWHSDFETWHVEDGMPRPRALSASVLLTDNGALNGPLLVIPGSHRIYVRCAGETPRDHYRSSLVDQKIGVPPLEVVSQLARGAGIDAAAGPAGAVVFFDSNLMHGSGGNITPYPRNNLFFVYNSTDNTLVEPFGTHAPRPAFLAERSRDPPTV